MLRLQDQRLEHRYWIKRRTTALGAIPITKTINQPVTKILEIDCRIENFKRIAVLAQQGKMIRKTEKTVRIHDNTSVSSVNHIAGLPARLIRVSSYLDTVPM